jgi:putative photosynthetic complex assembly protein 2
MLIAAAILYAVFLWWFSTGALFLLVRLPRASYGYGMVTAALIGILALAGLAATHGNTGVTSVFAGFTYGIIIWAVLELTFLYGYVTGPSQSPCPPGATGFRRFKAAFATMAYHEIALLLAGAGLAFVDLGSHAPVAFGVFALLWAMRVSAKLNIFLGAPQATDSVLPDHLRHLASYFERRKVSGFFPLSVTLASLAFGFVVHAAMSAADPAHSVALTFIATFLALAIIEHWFLVLPIAETALWRWALGSERPPQPSATPKRTTEKAHSLRQSAP